MVSGKWKETAPGLDSFYQIFRVDSRTFNSTGKDLLFNTELLLIDESTLLPPVFPFRQKKPDGYQGRRKILERDIKADYDTDVLR